MPSPGDCLMARISAVVDGQPIINVYSFDLITPGCNLVGDCAKPDRCAGRGARRRHGWGILDGWAIRWLRGQRR